LSRSFYTHSENPSRLVMIFFRAPELLLEEERREGRRIPWKEVSEATGISVQVLSNLGSRRQPAVTNTAYVEALCRYFRCSISDLVEFSPPIEESTTCNVDELYPERRRGSSGRSSG